MTRWVRVKTKRTQKGSRVQVDTHSIQYAHASIVIMKYAVMSECMLTSLTVYRSNVIIFQVYHLVGMLNHSTGGRGREKRTVRKT